jgi:phosphotransferase system enzyme I (PtsP)
VKAKAAARCAPRWPRAAGQAADRITHLIADSMGTEVCSIYLLRDPTRWSFAPRRASTPEAVHQTRMRIGEGLVGRVARAGAPSTPPTRPAERAFATCPRPGRRVFLLPRRADQRLGERLGVLVVQSKEAREYSGDEVYALEVVAMVLAEMTELGAFTGEGAALRERTRRRRCSAAAARRKARPWAMSGCTSRAWWSPTRRRRPDGGTQRLHEAVERLRVDVDQMLTASPPATPNSARCWRPTGCSPIPAAGCGGWRRTSRAACRPRRRWRRNSRRRARGWRRCPDAYLRDRLHDLDDLSNRLLRLLTGQGQDTGAECRPDPILVARNIGPPNCWITGGG